MNPSAFTSFNEYIPIACKNCEQGLGFGPVSCPNCSQQRIRVQLAYSAAAKIEAKMLDLDTKELAAVQDVAEHLNWFSPKMWAALMERVARWNK